MKGGNNISVESQNRILKLIIVLMICSFSFYSFMDSNKDKSEKEVLEVTGVEADTELNLIEAQNATLRYRASRPDQAFAFQISKQLVSYANSEMSNDASIHGYRCYYGVDVAGNHFVIFRELDEEGNEIDHYTGDGTDPHDDEHQVQYAAMVYSSYEKFPYAFPCPDFCDKSNLGADDPYIFD